MNKNQTESVRIRTVDGFQLDAVVTVPQELRGFALLMHGITVDKNEFGNFYVDLSESLGSSGIGSLRFDFRGHGQSSGTSMDVSVAGDVLDIEAVARYVGELWDGTLSLIATSFGAGPTVFYAAQNERKVKNLILIAPVLDYQRTFLKPETPWAGESFTPEAIQSAHLTGHIFLDGTFKLSVKLLEEFAMVRPYEDLKKLSLPVLIIHGDRDSMVPYDVSKEASRYSRNLKLHTIRDGDHGYPDYKDDEGTGQKSRENKQSMIEEIVRATTG